tara:strand:+ start:171 stop:461 length:291 start_codon:yes stop_codon:yes gene_type:complete
MRWISGLIRNVAYNSRLLSGKKNVYVSRERAKDRCRGMSRNVAERRAIRAVPSVKWKTGFLPVQKNAESEMNGHRQLALVVLLDCHLQALNRLFLE